MLEEEIAALDADLTGEWQRDNDDNWLRSSAGWMPEPRRAQIIHPRLSSSVNELLELIDSKKPLFEMPAWAAATTVALSIRELPFAKGRFRKAHRALIEPQRKPYVLKCDLRASEAANPGGLSEEVEMLAVCQVFAELFNVQAGVTKRIHFVDVSLLRLEKAGPSRHTKRTASYEYATLEPLIEGKYIRFNNNAGYAADRCRTVQAFSHFTYHRSGNRLMIVDLQGAKDSTHYLLTDPAIHCVCRPDVFGITNRGQEGITDFFSTHQCNSVCSSLGLPRNNALPSWWTDDSDTL